MSSLQYYYYYYTTFFQFRFSYLATAETEGGRSSLQTNVPIRCRSDKTILRSNKRVFSKQICICIQTERPHGNRLNQREMACGNDRVIVNVMNSDGPIYRLVRFVTATCCRRQIKKRTLEEPCDNVCVLVGVSGGISAIQNRGRLHKNAFMLLFFRLIRLNKHVSRLCTALWL